MTHRAENFDDIFEASVNVKETCTAKKFIGDGSQLTFTSNLPNAVDGTSNFVFGDVNWGGQMMMWPNAENAGYGGYGSKVIFGSGGSTSTVFDFNNYVSFGRTVEDDFIFVTNALERARIMVGGNFLIGSSTDNGVDKLQVEGSGSFTGDLTAPNLCYANGTNCPVSYSPWLNDSTTIYQEDTTKNVQVGQTYDWLNNLGINTVLGSYKETVNDNYAGVSGRIVATPTSNDAPPAILGGYFESVSEGTYDIGAQYGILGVSTINTNGSVTTADGLYFSTVVTGNATVGLATGVNAFLWLNNGYTEDAVGLNIQTQKDFGSDVTNLYGIKIGDVVDATNNYAIKTGSGPVDFGDQLTVNNRVISKGGSSGYNVDVGVVDLAGRDIPVGMRPDSYTQPILNVGLNPQQWWYFDGDDKVDITGSMFRLDGRPQYPYFQILRQPANGAEFEEYNDLAIQTDGTVLVGPDFYGVGIAGDYDLQVHSNAYIGGSLDVASGTSLGTEKLTNGTFTGSATGWTLGTGWAYSTNEVRKNAAGTGTLSQLSASMATPMVIGEVYELVFTVTALTSGGFDVSAGGKALGYVQSTGTYTYDFYCSDNTADLTFTPRLTTDRYNLDNISLKKVSLTGGTINTANLNLTGNITIENKVGITGNYKINGSTAQCWMNYTGGLLTASSC